MKKINKLGSLVTVLAASLCLAGCSDQFLQDKQNYGSTTGLIYNDYQGAKGRVEYLYGQLLPNATASVGYNQPSTGSADDWAKSTEEYGSLSTFVDGTVWSSNDMPDYIYYQNNNIAPYGRIRECNDIIEGITNGTLSQDQKEELLGQAYFFRAWLYYLLVKVYGGVPLVKQVQNPTVGDDGGLSLVIPRSTTKDCIDFICEDLKTASEYLPARWENEGTNYGRITAGAALALQGRARLLYASPLFNRSDDKERWKLAYESNKAAITKLKEGNWGLAYADKTGMNASGWSQMFSDVTSPEAVFVTLYNNQKSTSDGFNKNNTWEQSIRPKNAGGSGGKATTAQMVDLFPMADGKKPGSSIYPYDDQLFFLNRDPRFYRTFAFPGVRWAFSGDPTTVTNSGCPYQGKDYALWNYAWYDNAKDRDAIDQKGYAADLLGTSNTSIYVRKRTDDSDLNGSPRYVYDLNNSGKYFEWCAAPYMEIRYAEVLLNFAESACGYGELTEAVEALKEVRLRVGYTGDCGLDTDLSTDRAKLFAAILYERQIELAYEGKRFDDMRRWMLWDGGQDQESFKSSWKLAGFGGNTCTYLGVSPLNNTRRDGIEVRVADAFGTAEEKDGMDPITAAGHKAERDAALINLKNDATIATDTESNPAAVVNKPIDKLAAFYRNYLTRKTTRVDGDPIYKIDFKPKYYIIGFKNNMQQANSQLEQTIGWSDSMHGGANGTFDPLAE